MTLNVKRVMLWILLAIAVPAQTSTDPATQLAQLRKRASDARNHHDNQALLATMIQMARLLHYSGPSEERLARAYAAVGDKSNSLQAVREFVNMQQADEDLIAAPELAALKDNAEFQRLTQQMKLNETAIQNSVAVATIADSGLVAEDLAYDPIAKIFYVTSVLKKKIVRVRADGRVEDFAAAPDGWPMLAIALDAQRGIVWATEAAMDQFSAAPAKDWGKSAIVCFRSSDGVLLKRFLGPAKSALGDMALTSDGDAIVSDGAGGGVYRVRLEPSSTDSLERIDGGEFISPQTPAMHPDGKHVFIPDYARGIGVLDLATKKVRWIDSEHHHALQGIDGLYYHDGGLIAVQNGANPERVVLFRLDPGLTRILSERTIERATPTIGDPTHGVLISGSFYYIANSGWSELDDHGNVKSGSKLTSALIMRADVNKLH
jgi:sugar lactone lactonase YvrE